MISGQDGGEQGVAAAASMAPGTRPAVTPKGRKRKNAEDEAEGEKAKRERSECSATLISALNRVGEIKEDEDTRGGIQQIL
jgi:hypothetical protein